MQEELGRPKLEGKRLNLNSHVTLCRLARLNKSDGRLVTTNFDRLFEKALARLRRKQKDKHRSRIEIAPALSPPKPDGWASLVYLHGKMGDASDDKNLVLTTADFGKAYLLDGWARRVVIDLFRHFHVVFFGYSIEDPTMRYLVSALAAAREDNERFRDAYAFAAFGEGDNEPDSKEETEQAWEIKGVIPIAYDSENHHRKQGGDGSEEFPVYVRTGWGNDNEPGKMENFSSMGADKFIEWAAIRHIVGEDTRVAGYRLPELLNELALLHPDIADDPGFHRLLAREQ